MIFVTVGTNEARFDRLLRAVARLRTEDELVIQHGHSSAIGPPGATFVAFLPFDELVETTRRARVIVTHAGVGSIMVALANAKRPIVVPRRRSHGEAVDDHQLQLARRFAEAGLVALVETQAELEEAVAGDQDAAALVPTSSSLAADLRVFVEHALARSATRAPA